jgi:hypothetical protein
MAANNQKEINQKGQALFELIIFLPLLLYMIKILFDYGDSINHSINQLKVVRGYYHYVNANDSNLPNLMFAQDFAQRGVLGHIGSDAYAWSSTKTTNGVNPTGSCVKIFSFLGSGISGDECLDPQVEDGNKTQFIRSFSAYGVCTGSWAAAQNSPNLYFLDWQSASTIPCTRTANR